MPDVSKDRWCLQRTGQAIREDFRVIRKSSSETSNFSVIINIIIIRHELGLDRSVSASSNCLFKAIPGPLRPFGPKGADPTNWLFYLAVEK